MLNELVGSVWVILLTNVFLAIALIPGLVANKGNDRIITLLLIFMAHLVIQPLTANTTSVANSYIYMMLTDVLLGFMAWRVCEKFAYLIIGMLFMFGVMFNLVAFIYWIDLVANVITADQFLRFLDKQEVVIIGLTLLQSAILIWNTYLGDRIRRLVSSVSSPVSGRSAS